MHELNLLIIGNDYAFVSEVQTGLRNVGFGHTEKMLSTKSATFFIDNHHPDLVFITCKKGDDGNFQLAKELKELGIALVILSSQFDNTLYDKIFEIRPLAYFTKPLDFIAIKYQIESYFHSNQNILKENLTKKERKRYFYLKKRNTHFKVNIDDILYIQAEGNYITVVTADTKFVIRSSLKRGIVQLPEGLFLQVRRNFVVNTMYLDEFDSENCTVRIGQEQIPVGRSFLNSLKNILQ